MRWRVIAYVDRLSDQDEMRVIDGESIIHFILTWNLHNETNLPIGTRNYDVVKLILKTKKIITQEERK